MRGLVKKKTVWLFFLVLSVTEKKTWCQSVKFSLINVEIPQRVIY